LAERSKEIHATITKRGGLNEGTEGRKKDPRMKGGGTGRERCSNRKGKKAGTTGKKRLEEKGKKVKTARCQIRATHVSGVNQKGPKGRRGSLHAEHDMGKKARPCFGKGRLVALGTKARETNWKARSPGN